MPNPTQQTDVAIIGAGPAGLFAVFQCGMLGLKCHVIDALEAAGGQCQALYPEKPIYDIPGHPSILAGDLVTALLAQAAPFAPVYHLGRQVVGLARDGEEWRLETDKGDVIRAAAVMIAAGVGAFGPNRPPLDGLTRFEGQGEGVGVNYLVQSRENFRGKRVVIAGGGDSAVDWAVSLAEVAAQVAIVHRRPKFRAAPGSVEKMGELAKSGKVELVTPYQLAGLEGDMRLEAVVAADLDGQTRRLEADVLLPFFGLSQNLGPITEWGLDIERGQIKIDRADCSAGQPGLFAIGDIASYPGKLKLILTGFAEAATASHAAFAFARPGQALHVEHSTSIGVPGRSATPN